MSNNNVYIHSDKIKYPDKDFVHMVESEKAHDFVFDENFPYRLKDKKSLFIRFWMRVVVFILVKPLCYIRYSLIIKGKRNIKEYQRIAKSKAMISICNHTTEWDTLIVMTSRYCHFPEFPIWQEGAEGKSGNLYRYMGGITLPTSSYKGGNYAFEAMREVVKEGKWLHVFPEAACWAFYPAIRQFRMGVFRLAVEEDMPILPMVVKYRRPNALYRIFKKDPNATLLIGSPVIPDNTLDKNERIKDLHDRCRHEMMALLGLNEQTNQQVRDSLPTYHKEQKTSLI